MSESEVRCASCRDSGGYVLLDGSRLPCVACGSTGDNHPAPVSDVPDDITHQRRRHAETGEGVKTTKDFAEYLRHECEGNPQLAAAVEAEREVIRAGMSAPQPAAGREGVERFCRACNKPLLPENNWMCDGCPCNCERGTNHGLVSKEICTCDGCSPVAQHDANKLVELFNGIAPGVEWLPLSERLIAIQGFLRHGGWFSTQHEYGVEGSSQCQLPSVNANQSSWMRQNAALRTQLAEANAKLDRIRKAADADEADLKVMRDGTKMTRHGIVQMLAYQQEDIAELKGQLAEANQRCEAAEREVEGYADELAQTTHDLVDTAKEVATLTAERDRLAGELEVFKKAVKAARDEAVNKGLRVSKWTGFTVTINNPLIDRLHELFELVQPAPAAGVSHE